jgi:hypothetical protein
MRSAPHTGAPGIDHWPLSAQAHAPSRPSGADKQKEIAQNEVRPGADRWGRPCNRAKCRARQHGVQASSRCGARVIHHAAACAPGTARRALLPEEKVTRQAWVMTGLRVSDTQPRFPPAKMSSEARWNTGFANAPEPSAVVLRCGGPPGGGAPDPSSPFGTWFNRGRTAIGASERGCPALSAPARVSRGAASFLRVAPGRPRESSDPSVPKPQPTQPRPLAA